MEVTADLQITDLALRDHACLTFGDSAEQLDLTAAFLRDGLAHGLKVLWVSESAGLLESDLAERGLQAEAALASGQMSAVGCEGHLLSGQAFTSGRAVSWLSGQVAACQAEGFAGLRVAVDMSWALRPVSGVEELPAFEERVAGTLADSNVTMLCQYDRERFDPVTLASIAPWHTHAVAAATYHADAVLRICRQYAPPGVRLAGEIDYRAEEPLTVALGEALRIDSDITINMSDLRFIDAFCSRMILNAARSLSRPRTMILRCAPATASQFLLFGATEVPGVAMVTVHDI